MKFLTHFFSLILIYSLITIIISVFTYEAHNLIYPVTLLFVFLYSLFISKLDSYIRFSNFKKYSPVYAFVFLFLIAGLILKSYFILFTYVIFIPIFYYLGVKFNYYKKGLILLSTILLLLINYQYIYPNIDAYFNHLNKSVNYKSPELNLFDKNKTKINLKDDKIIVLDFWTRGCGVCYEKFPELEELYKKYKSNKNIEIYSVNVLYYKKDNFEKTTKLLDNYPYTFPQLFAISGDEINEKLGINKFPTLIIIKNNRIRQEGFLITDENVIINNTINIIESLLNETN